MDKSRQQFEYWYFNNHSHEQKYPLHKDDSGEYFYNGARKAWFAWKASRESLEVELPDKYTLEYMQDDLSDSECDFFKCKDVENMLNINGVKIKNE
ncbi:TPA: hypothetical protein VEO38_002043 [Providencia alcalifaciens]|nr:hypothetical protein [Providencia alcalifaciens]